jgi:hypothetical protein
MDTKVISRTGSGLPEVVEHLPAERGGTGELVEPVFGLGATAFSTWYYWRAHGVFQNVRFVQRSVRADSRVFVNISEYGNTPQQRFIGAARLGVYNIAPYDGGFLAWVEIGWGNDINVRFDVLVDP